MRSTRTGVRRLAAWTALVAFLLCAGCAGEVRGVAEPAVPVDEITARIEQGLAARDDVAAADVRYQDDFMHPSTVSADITMQPGADAEALYAEGARLIWLSDLEPLTSFAINVIDPEDPPSGISRVVGFSRESERRPLEEAYGPRPR